MSAANMRRCANAADALARHEEFNVDPRAALVDLLTDLRHWARSRHISFDRAATMSEIHFNVEVQS